MYEIINRIWLISAFQCKKQYIGIIFKILRKRWNTYLLKTIFFRNTTLQKNKILNIAEYNLIIKLSAC